MTTNTEEDEFQKQARHIYENTPTPQPDTTLDKYFNREEKIAEPKPLRSKRNNQKKARQETYNQQLAQRVFEELQYLYDLKNDPNYEPKPYGSKKTYKRNWKLYDYVHTNINV